MSAAGSAGGPGAGGPALPSAAAAFGRILVDELARGGVREAVLAPGSRSAPLALALAGDERVRLHVRHDERSAAFLALGLARTSGRPAVLVCTSGTAAASFHPAVIEADRSGVPLLVCTADRPHELRDTGANQTIDQVRLYGGSVRWFADVGVPVDADAEWRYWRSLAARALAEAAGGRRGWSGPVHLNCALREPLVGDRAGGSVPRDLGGRSGGAPWVEVLDAAQPLSGGADERGRREGSAGGGPSGAGERLRALARAHERGVVVAGDVRLRAPARAALVAEHLGWPLLAEPMAGARIGGNAVSTADALLRAPGVAGAVRPDAALVLGKVGLSRAVLGWLADVPHVALVTAGPGVPDPLRGAGLVTAADPDWVLEALLAAFEGDGRRDTGWIGWWRAAERAAAAAMDAVLDADDTPSEPRTARDLAAWLPADGLLVAASSMPIRDLDAVVRPRDRTAGGGPRVLASRGASGIDGFVSTAVGAALVHPGPTAALAGDLSLLHDANGLLLTGQPTPDLPLVVVNNDGGGIFSFLPQADLPAHFEQVFGTPHGLDLGALVTAYGARHRRLERAGDLPAMLDDALAGGGVQVVEVRTDRRANVALHARLREAVAAAVPPPPPPA